MIKIVDSHEIPFVHKRKHLIAFINEGKTVWEVFIRYKRDFLADGWTEKKRDFKTPQEVLDYVFEKVKHKLETNKKVMKRIIIDDLVRINPDCKFKIAECGDYTTIVKSELKHSVRDGYFTANSNIRFCLSAIDFGEYVYVDDEDYEKYFKSLG